MGKSAFEGKVVSVQYTLRLCAPVRSRECSSKLGVSGNA